MRPPMLLRRAKARRDLRDTQRPCHRVLLAYITGPMIDRARMQEFFNWRPVRLTLFGLGVLLMIVSPIAGAIPGPGGIFVFAGGLALALRNSPWAKRRYVHFKRWQPRFGAWADWGLRRRSAKRREEMRKARDRAESPLAHEVERIDDPLPASGFELAPSDPTPGELAPPRFPGSAGNPDATSR